ncbi:hypothetical protein DL95DRAFT_465582 [Leptodontidium sp. 2 PMI_412]|nr:hypothetical protein DL95DRAFT_465582 [Leptodontidium sp. 2 PMI_412]
MQLANNRGPKSTQSTSLFLNLTPSEWNPKFATRQPDLDYRMENKTYIETGGVDEDVVRTFMQDPDESDVCSPQADLVEAYCVGASLEALEAEEGEASELLVAYLDDREFIDGGGPGRQRPYRGRLTARDLFRELKKPRFCCGGSSPSFGNDTITTVKEEVIVRLWNLTEKAPSESQKKKGKAKGERKRKRKRKRKRFITGLDRWSIYALVTTASDYQTPGLRSAIYGHLAFENFIGVTFPPKGIAMFQLAFHLPYYVWRKSPKAHEDHRIHANGRPLRQSQNVSFLDRTSSETPSFLYEAQVSCLVSGTDESRWVAYVFVDNYFEVDGEGKETVSSYHEDSLGEDGERMDPLTYGTCPVNRPDWNPRKYFLVVFRVRLNQINCEWQQLVAKIKGSVREYAHDYSLSLSGKRSSSKEALEYDDKVRRSRDWIVQVRMLSKELSMELSKTVHACERFCLKYAVYFQDPAELPNEYRTLPAIQNIFDQLESLKMTLEYLTERCDNYIRELETQLSLENNQVGILQQKMTHDSKWLSVVMMSSLPVALTAGIFSMDQNVIPFLPASFGSFVSLIIIFGILGMVIVIHFVPSYHTRCWQLVGDLAWPKLWEKKTKVSCSSMLRFSRYWLFGNPLTPSDEENPPAEQAPS